MLCFTQLNVHVIILLNKSASEKIVSLICLNIINSVMARSFPSLWELLPMHWNRLLFVVIVSSYDDHHDPMRSYEIYDDHMMIIWWSYEIITKKSIIRGSALWWIIIILSLSENYTPVASLLCSITSSSLQWQSSASWSSPGLKLYLAITETSSIRTNTIISTKIQTVISNVLDCFRLESSSHQDQQDYHQDHQDQQDNQEDHHSETSNVLKTCLIQCSQLFSPHSCNEKAEGGKGGKM